MSMRRSLLLVAAFAASGTACQALALPTPQPTPPPTHTMSAVVQVPVGADKAHVDTAEAVFARRLKTLGITNFTGTSSWADPKMTPIRLPSPPLPRSWIPGRCPRAGGDRAA